MGTIFQRTLNLGHQIILGVDGLEQLRICLIHNCLIGSIAFTVIQDHILILEDSGC
jgi:hypothetical protein